MSQITILSGGGSGGSGITTIAGDFGSITGSNVIIYAGNSVNNCGASVYFDNLGIISTLNLTDLNNNTFLAKGCGNSTLTGNDNLGFGFGALSGIDNVENCLGIGRNSVTVTEKDNTVGVGAGSLQFNTTGDNNQAFGYLCFNKNVSGSNLTGCGRSVFGNAISNDNNSGFGYSVGLNNSGDNNSVFGAFAFVTTGTASNSALFGFQSGNAITNGNGNSGFGYATLNQLQGGSFNTAMGFFSGQNYNGSESNNILINNSGVMGESGIIRIGTSGTHSACFIQGIAGVTVPDSQIVTVNVAGQLGSVPTSFFQINYFSADVDMTQTGITPIFQSTGGNFLTTNFITAGINLSGTISGSVFNVGWTAPDYNDIFDFQATTVLQSDQYSNIPVSSPSLQVPLGETVYINIITPDGTATTSIQKAVLQGFYLP